MRPRATPAAVKIAGAAAEMVLGMQAASLPARGGLPARARRRSLARAPQGRRRRGQGQASFFFYDAHFRNDAVKILPGEYFVYHEDILIVTTLGSCIAACLWDRERRVGGMNHFMLPDGNSRRRQRPRYGSCTRWSC